MLQPTHAETPRTLQSLPSKNAGTKLPFAKQTPKRLAACLSSAFALFTLSIAHAETTVTYYDVPRGHWAEAAVAGLTQKGILEGYPDGRFDGTRATTRYEMAVFGARLLAAMADPLSLESVKGATPSKRLIVAGKPTVSYSVPGSEQGSVGERVTAIGRASVTLTEETPIVQHTVSAQADAPLSGEVSVDNQASPAVAPAHVRLSTRPAYPAYVGIFPGIISTAGDVYLAMNFGYDGLVGPVGPSARLVFNGGNRELRYSFALLAKADLMIPEFKIYAGLGLGGTERPSGGSQLLEAPFGAEYFITPRVSLLAQLTTSYSFRPISEVDAELSSGINFHF